MGKEYSVMVQIYFANKGAILTKLVCNLWQCTWAGIMGMDLTRMFSVLPFKAEVVIVCTMPIQSAVQ